MKNKLLSLALLFSIGTGNIVFGMSDDQKEAVQNLITQSNNELNDTISNLTGQCATNAKSIETVSQRLNTHDERLGELEKNNEEIFNSITKLETKTESIEETLVKFTNQLVEQYSFLNGTDNDEGIFDRLHSLESFNNHIGQLLEEKLNSNTLNEVFLRSRNETSIKYASKDKIHAKITFWTLGEHGITQQETQEYLDITNLNKYKIKEGINAPVYTEYLDPFFTMTIDDCATIKDLWDLAVVHNLDKNPVLNDQNDTEENEIIQNIFIEAKGKFLTQTIEKMVECFISSDNIKQDVEKFTAQTGNYQEAILGANAINHHIEVEKEHLIGLIEGSATLIEVKGQDGNPKNEKLDSLTRIKNYNKTQKKADRIAKDDGSEIKTEEDADRIFTTAAKLVSESDHRFIGQTTKSLSNTQVGEVIKFELTKRDNNEQPKTSLFNTKNTLVLCTVLYLIFGLAEGRYNREKGIRLYPNLLSILPCFHDYIPEQEQ